MRFRSSLEACLLSVLDQIVDFLVIEQGGLQILSTLEMRLSSYFLIRQWCEFPIWRLNFDSMVNPFFYTDRVDIVCRHFKCFECQ